MATKERIVKFIKDREGGFVNDPNDRGGATNKGVTLGVRQREDGGGFETDLGRGMGEGVL